jgi:hypothetical protein
MTELRDRYIRFDWAIKSLLRQKANFGVLEGFEWSDFKRWNKAVVRKSFEEGGNAHPSVAITIKPEDGNKWTWGVPLNETDYNADATAPKIN